MPKIRSITYLTTGDQGDLMVEIIHLFDGGGAAKIEVRIPYDPDARIRAIEESALGKAKELLARI